MDINEDASLPDDHIPDRAPSALSTQTAQSFDTLSLYSTTVASNKWLLANYDPNASLYTFSSCICMCDLHGDGDFKLIIADLGLLLFSNIKLKVYRGMAMVSEHALVDVPSGIVSFHMDPTDPHHTPAIAVASGSYLYIYRNLRPFYKFSLPTLEANQLEMDVWNEVKDAKIDVLTLKDTLANIRTEIGDTNLTSRSQTYLTLDNLLEMDKFVNAHKDQPLKRLTVITCITTIKKTVADENAVSCLVIGTENSDIYILEPEAFTILSSVSLPHVPVFLEVNGIFDVEYRILVSCRDAHIYTIKRGFKTGRLCVQLNSQPVGLLRVNNNIVVGCMDMMLHTYTTKGNCLWSVKQAAGITTLEGVDVEILGLRLVAVALENRQVHLYQDKNRVDILQVEDVIVAMKYGRFGREDNTLVMVSRKGYLIIKILKRTAKFVVHECIDTTAQMLISSKLNVPKKTKLFVDQTMREREQSISIHRTFQHDLYRLKLTAARAYVKAITASLNPLSSNSNDPLKLSAQVHGLGPIFRLMLELQNTSVDQPSMNLFLTFQCDVRIYKIERSFIPVPFLAPGFIYTFATKVECVSELNVSDMIKVYVLKDGEIIPLITAVISMPVSEAQM